MHLKVTSNIKVHTIIYYLKTEDIALMARRYGLGGIHAFGTLHKYLALNLGGKYGLRGSMLN